MKRIACRVLLAVALMVGVVPSRSVAQSQTNLHLALGAPSGERQFASRYRAARTFHKANQYLIQRPQYAVMYSLSLGTPAWVSWHLGFADLGSVPRGDFATDTSLPSGFYRVRPEDYTNSGYDRGHMIPSGDRTATVADNDATFLMTNILPQAPDNNQGVWADLEIYCRELVRAGNELYIVSGGRGTIGTLAAGRINIPAYTWKVIVVLPAGDRDLARIDVNTRVIAVDIPNTNGIRDVPWRTYRASVDQVEAVTGLDFLARVSQSVQSIVEARIDDR
ncbi:MAG: DNA/RNA non-specific endonuclease [Pyrinomonadaceae bacterium MAG19_C2-C3]|nr:DNA/RNA non-specific endonuclease [Pyrinomonadaceae bacterium MAG19_C2-C3]